MNIKFSGDLTQRHQKIVGHFIPERAMRHNERNDERNATQEKMPWLPMPVSLNCLSVNFFPNYYLFTFYFPPAFKTVTFDALCTAILPI